MLTVTSGSRKSNIESFHSDLPMLKDGLGHISFCADEMLVEDVDREGHIYHHVMEAIRLGVDKMQAYFMATLKPAAYYRIDHLIGSITPGKLADLLILDDLEDVRSVHEMIQCCPPAVIVNGKLVAENNKALLKNTDTVLEFTLNSIHINGHFL